MNNPIEAEEVKQTHTGTDEPRHHAHATVEKTSEQEPQPLWTIIIPPQNHVLIAYKFSGSLRKHVQLGAGPAHPQASRMHSVCEDGRRISLIVNNYSLTDPMQITFNPFLYPTSCMEDPGDTPVALFKTTTFAPTGNVHFYYFEAIPVGPNSAEKIGIVIVLQEGVEDDTIH